MTNSRDLFKMGIKIIITENLDTATCGIYFPGVYTAQNFLVSMMRDCSEGTTPWARALMVLLSHMWLNSTSLLSQQLATNMRL